MTAEKNEIVNIDYEMIKFMKLNGRYKEALDLLMSHQNALKKNFAEGKKQNKKMGDLIIRKKKAYDKRMRTTELEGMKYGNERF